jgi:hypothetical protein
MIAHDQMLDEPEHQEMQISVAPVLILHESIRPSCKHLGNRS